MMDNHPAEVTGSVTTWLGSPGRAFVIPRNAEERAGSASRGIAASRLEVGRQDGQMSSQVFRSTYRHRAWMTVDGHPGTLPR